VREVGQQLFQALFAGPLYRIYRASLEIAQQHGNRMRVVLRLATLELDALPWETLFDPETKTYLCRHQPLVRHIPAPYTTDPLEVRPPLRILGMVASPKDLPPLDVDAEKSCMVGALAGPMAAHPPAGGVEHQLIFRHCGYPSPQRNQRRSGDAVSHQRFRSIRVRPRLLHSYCPRPQYRRSSPQRTDIHPRVASQPGMDYSYTVPAGRGEATFRLPLTFRYVRCTLNRRASGVAAALQDLFKFRTFRGRLQLAAGCP